MLGGVCGGLADYFDADPTLIRIGFVVLTLFTGIGLPLYPVMWLIMPEEETTTTADEPSTAEPASDDIDVEEVL